MGQMLTYILSHFPMSHVFVGPVEVNGESCVTVFLVWSENTFLDFLHLDESLEEMLLIRLNKENLLIQILFNIY